MILTTILTVLAFLAGLAVARHYRDDESVCAFADSLLTLVVLPAQALKAKLTQPQPERPAPKRVKAE